MSTIFISYHYMRSFFICFKGFPVKILFTKNKYAKSKPNEITKEVTVIAVLELMFLNPQNASSKINGNKRKETKRIRINLGTFVLPINQPTKSKNSSMKNSITISKITSNFVVTSF